MTVSGLEALIRISQGRPFAGQRAGLLTHPAAELGTRAGRTVASPRPSVEHLTGMLAESRIDVLASTCRTSAPGSSLTNQASTMPRFAEVERKPYLLYPREGEC